MPKISILIPTFNRCEFLTQCLDVLKDQTLKDYNIIVYDDGSTIITTKPSIATGTTEGVNSLNCACDDPATVTVGGSIMTVGIPAVSTTPPNDGYVQLYFYPSVWRSWT